MTLQPFLQRVLRCGLAVFVVIIVPHVVAAETQGIDAEQAKRYFDEARGI